MKKYASVFIHGTLGENYSSVSYTMLFEIGAIDDSKSFKIKKVIIDNSSGGMIFKEKDSDGFMLWNWKVGNYRWCEEYLTVIKDNYNILEFEDDEDAELWFRLNY